jgi:hypothetical protein
LVEVFARRQLLAEQALSTDPRAGVVRRHHISESVIQKAAMIYTHVVKELRNPARSLLDILRARLVASSAQE